MDPSVIISGIGAGVTYALLGWGKSKGEAFDAIKFGTTIVLGIVAGIGLAVSGIPLDFSIAYMTNLGLVPTIENLLKMAWRRLLGN